MQRRVLPDRRRRPARDRGPGPDRRSADRRVRQRQQGPPRERRRHRGGQSAVRHRRRSSISRPPRPGHRRGCRAGERGRPAAQHRRDARRGPAPWSPRRTRSDPSDPTKQTPNNQRHRHRSQGDAAQGAGHPDGGSGRVRRLRQSRGDARARLNLVDGTVSIFTIQGQTVTPAGTLEVGGEKGRRQDGRDHPGRQDRAGLAQQRQQGLGALDRRQPRSSTPSAIWCPACGRS